MGSFLIEEMASLFKYRGIWNAVKLGKDSLTKIEYPVEGHLILLNNKIRFRMSGLSDY